MTRHKTRHLLLLVALFAASHAATAQHTLGFMAGYGMANGRFDPKMETRAQWGIYTGGLSWRYYGTQRFVGGFGIDLEFIQQGFSFAPNAALVEEEKDYQWYTRRINSIMLPVVWQPHVYLLRNRVRVYLEAAATFSYNISSTYENEYARDRGEEPWKGDYDFKLPRDNRWGYGLAGGGGITAARRYIMPSLLRELRAKIHQLNGNELNRVQMKVYDLDNDEEFAAFAKGDLRTLKVYGTDRYVAYDPQKRVGVMISKLGASKAISVGAYAFALSQLDQEAGKEQ